MRIIFDQGTPAPLRRFLADHEVSTAYELGWSNLENGDLLDAAESEGFEVFVTTDRNLCHQQELSSRNIAILVLATTSWPLIQRDIPAVLRALGRVVSESYVEVRFSASGPR